MAPRQHSIVTNVIDVTNVSGTAAPGSQLVVVGPCASGKSTLVAALARVGISARSVAQEHSAVPTLFQRRPRAGVVYLAATWPAVHRRRPLSTGRAQYQRELHILAAARAAADLVVHTDSRTPAEVAAVVQAWWIRHISARSSAPPA